jgi:hypothetical protein
MVPGSAEDPEAKRPSETYTGERETKPGPWWSSDFLTKRRIPFIRAHSIVQNYSEGWWLHPPSRQPSEDRTNDSASSIFHLPNSFSTAGSLPMETMEADMKKIPAESGDLRIMCLLRAHFPWGISAGISAGSQAGALQGPHDLFSRRDN